MGNWSVEVGGSSLSGPRGSGVQVQARLDHREKIWLNGTIEGRCLRTTAGYMNGKHTVIRAVFASVTKAYRLRWWRISVSRSRSERGRRCGCMCRSEARFDAGCAEKRGRQQTWNSGRRFCGISQSEADAESEWLFRKSYCGGGITSSGKMSQIFTVLTVALGKTACCCVHRHGFNIWALRSGISCWRESKLYNISSSNSGGR